MSAADSAMLTILYIDDDLTFGRLVQKQLERIGYRVTVAASGVRGLEAIRAGTIDAVALDHNLPEQDGLAILSHIRLLPDPPPVIYVTATNESRVAVAALKAGAADYVVKDIQDGFIDLIDVAIQSAIARDRLRRERDRADREMRDSRHRFEALAAERQILMREVNHRVGNSLQLVAAFLHMQSASPSANEETRTALADANRRVLAIAQVHRRLYASDDVKVVPLAIYLEGLIADIRASTDGNGAAMLSLLCVEADVDPDSAVTIGIIVTELVINALKYAYPGRFGPVRVSLGRFADELRLRVEDDGNGQGQAPSNSPRTGIGRTIITSMATRLHAQVNYDFSATGTRVLVSFPVPVVHSMVPSLDIDRPAAAAVN